MENISKILVRTLQQNLNSKGLENIPSISIENPSVIEIFSAVILFIPAS